MDGISPLSIMYLGVIFDKRFTWRLHLEIIEAKAFITFIRIYSLLKSDRLSAKIKITLHKALIRTVIKVLRTIGNFPRCTPVRDMHPAFNLSYVYMII
jgi:hypothetical protein